MLYYNLKSERNSVKSLVLHISLCLFEYSHIVTGAWGVQRKQTVDEYLEAVAKKAKTFATAFYTEKSIGAIWVCSNAKGRSP